MQNLSVDWNPKSDRFHDDMDKPISRALEQVKAATADALRLADRISEFKKKLVQPA